jgi:hypothetical protein
VSDPSVHRWRREEGDQSARVSNLVRGAVGVAKAAMGIGAASPQDYQARWAICMACDQHDAGRCRTCGCFTGAKVRVAQESCPVGKWVAVEPKPENLHNRKSDL